MGIPNSNGYGEIVEVLDAAPVLGEVEQSASTDSKESSYVDGTVLVVDDG